MEDADRTAIREVQAGNTTAFGELVRRHSPQILRVAARITRNEEDAEEAAQEAFLRAYRKLGSFEFRASFSTWLYRIAVRCAVETLEKRRPTERLTTGAARAVEIADTQAGPERLLLSGEVTSWQQQALRSLTPVERTAFVLRHLEERTTKEIAEILNLKPSAAKQAVFRAVQKLRLRMTPLKRNL
jgi:RNA polymerase sigma-70 factor (ECF subfamily)